MNRRRILIKVSGEALNGDGISIYDKATIDNFCCEIKKAKEEGYQIAIVVGAGNLLRGRDAENWGLDRPDADEMGMLFTVTNALMLRNKLSKFGITTNVMAPMLLGGITTIYNRKEAIKMLEDNTVVIFGGGIGNPFVSTDYPAVQKAIEIEADMLLMAKNIDGVYDSNPRFNENAKRYQQVSYDTCVKNKIKVCDTSAFILAEEFGVTMYLYDGKEKKVILNIIEGKNVGTIIKKDCIDVFY
ncbi:MAG TPA: UMP kinase [Mobilitalea sp.]|nr:UMP kinase [Mobilitalea sp.]